MARLAVYALSALGLALVAVFAISGAGDAQQALLLVPQSADVLGAWAGHPVWLMAGLICFCGGLALAPTTRPPEAEFHPYPGREVAHFSCACLALGFLALVLLGVAHRYTTRSLAVLYLIAALELLLALLFGVLSSLKPDKHLGFFASATAMTVVGLILGGLLIIV